MAAFTCNEMELHRSAIPRAFSGVKNLFLKDKKKRYYLLSALYETKVDLKYLAKMLDAPELRLARPDELEAVLGVAPGSVTPLALINDHTRCVTVVLDGALLAAECIGVHPLRNDMTTLISPKDLVKFLESMDYEHRIAGRAGLLGALQA